MTTFIAFPFRLRGKMGKKKRFKKNGTERLSKGGGVLLKVPPDLRTQSVSCCFRNKKKKKTPKREPKGPFYQGETEPQISKKTDKKKGTWPLTF